jgi:hypothetical protein
VRTLRIGEYVQAGTQLAKRSLRWRLPGR